MRNSMWLRCMGFALLLVAGGAHIDSSSAERGSKVRPRGRLAGPQALELAAQSRHHPLAPRPCDRRG